MSNGIISRKIIELGSLSVDCVFYLGDLKDHSTITKGRLSQDSTRIICELDKINLASTSSFSIGLVFYSEIFKSDKFVSVEVNRGTPITVYPQPGFSNTSAEQVIYR